MWTKLNSSGTSLTTREYDEVIAEVYVTLQWCSCLDQSFVLMTEEWISFEKTTPTLYYKWIISQMEVKPISN